MNLLSNKNIWKSHECGLLLAIVIVVVLTALSDSQHTYFYSPWESCVDITRQTAMLGIFSLGAAVVIIAGGIDLSSGSVIAFSGTICASIMLILAPEAMQNATPLGAGVISVAILGTLIVGLLIGSLHAWLITTVGLPPFVATLATLVGLRSLARIICEEVTEAVLNGRSTQINIYDNSFRYLATSVWIPALLFLLLAGFIWLTLSRTVVGRHLYALGGNETAAHLSGIRTDRMKWIAYCTSAVLSSIAGIIFIGNDSVAAPQQQGVGYELNAIAAAVVGGCSLQGGVGTIPGTVLGAIFLRTVMDGVAKIIKTSADIYEGMIVGVVVVVAVAFSQQQNVQGGHGFFKGWLGKVAILNLALFAALMAALLGPTFLQNKTALNAWHFALLTFLAMSGLMLILASQLAGKTRSLAAISLMVFILLAGFGYDRALPNMRYQAALQSVKQYQGKVQQQEDGIAVDLSGLQLNDAQFQSLVNQMQYLTNLTELNLKGVPITEKSIGVLMQLKVLRRLDLTGTKISPDNYRRLLRQNPDLSIEPF